jgi:hypothetical protein
MLMDEEQVRAVMGAVRDAIVNGTSKVVYDLAMEEKYQKASIRALRQGMEMVAVAFEMYMDQPEEVKLGFNDAGFWEPTRWEDPEGVCCMQGMSCWTGSFANAAGRARLESGLKEM